MARLEQESLFSRCVRGSLQTLAVAIPLLLVIHGPVHAATVPSCEPTHASTLDRRLVAKADQGVGELRRFVSRTRMVFQLDMPTALQRIDRQRGTDVACATPVASR